MSAPDAVPVRLGYDEVDDAVLDPATVALVGDELRVEGYVEASGLFIKRPRSVRSSDRVAVTLVVTPVTSWSFGGLDEGTGMVIAGDFHPREDGGHVEGVIPGDLFVESPSTPHAWFETTALVQGLEAVEFPFNV